jgi:uncharacterized membrane protein YkoI
MTKYTKTLALTVVGLSFAVAAQAADRSDIRSFAATKISLTEAIAAAEKHESGKAIEASLDDDSFKPAYEVSVVKDDRIFEVYVNGETGEVLGAREELDD